MRAYLEDNRITPHDIAKVTSEGSDKTVTVVLNKFRPKAYIEDTEFVIEVESISDYLKLAEYVKASHYATGGLVSMITHPDQFRLINNGGN